MEITINATDPTLDAVDAAIESAQDVSPRAYIGMSSIGEPCSRKLWYRFRFALVSRFDALTIKRVDDGHAGEALQAERLRMVTGIELRTEDEVGNQFGFSLLGGHLRGHMDGAILGLLQAPKTWHVWEHKQVGEKKFEQLKKLKELKGEKEALKAWDEIYYGQAITYMAASGMTRHYLTCSTPGGRDTISVRTNADRSAADRLFAKAQRIIDSAEPPDGVSLDASWYQCKLCDYAELCHGDAMPQRTCRSCAHVTPLQDGKWVCERHEESVSTAEQKLGCAQHLYIPAFYKRVAEPIDSGADWVMYRRKDNGETFVDGVVST